MSELMALEAYIVDLAAQWAWLIIPVIVCLVIWGWQLSKGEMTE